MPFPQLVTESPVYRKIKKLLVTPRQFIMDARLKRHPSLQLDRQRLRQASDAWQQGDTGLARSVLEALPDDWPQKWLHLAQMDLFQQDTRHGEYDAFRVLQQLKPSQPEFQAAFYLHQEALRKQGRFDEALSLLQPLPFRDQSARFYRALRLACLGMGRRAPFERALLPITAADKDWLRAHNHYLLLLRDLGERDRALAEADHLMGQVLQSPPGKARPAPVRSPDKTAHWQARAALALAQLKEDLGKQGIDFFLVSGTLLGCVREGGILGHDSDIDVGVMPDISMQALQAAVAASPRFKPQETRSDNTLYLIHPNGVKIDVFRHYEEDGRLYHGGIKCRWWNTPFTLVTRTFLGEEYLIPNDADTYLTENYGDWRTPVTAFETFLDTPNLEVTEPAGMALYHAAQCMAAHRSGQMERSGRHRQIFTRLKNQITSKDNPS
ncbi:hypothetical protein ECTPHS_10234 [Ectothiorhodospira sp. PHS-1]|uniref:LicD family protein n=1 Tax=Ectothiorhodospira sp. PHS-1 TaxID=519989 RepID=UPI00024A89E6|nr:LicD family protein [Ectothiorhodospira sp. PHS-1]EHQ53058.1 hypothetical protein ECTPHS_10234 [Ectothiorhodospira sp. PHS-1]